MSVRLNKFLSEAGVASRREADRLILEGRVRLNGELVRKLGIRVDPENDRIEVNGRRIRKSEDRVYFILNKPPGYLVTRRDPWGRPTVMDLLPSSGTRVNPVGRLDLESEGLLLLTNDGEMANRLLHPRYGIKKVYMVKVKGSMDPSARERLEKGIFLDGKKTAPAKIKVMAQNPKRTLFRIELSEGRKREIRRMMEAVGCRVVQLRRTHFGGLSLTGVQPGRWRHLKRREVELLKKKVGLGRPERN